MFACRLFEVISFQSISVTFSQLVGVLHLGNPSKLAYIYMSGRCNPHITVANTGLYSVIPDLKNVIIVVGDDCILGVDPMYNPLYTSNNLDLIKMLGKSSKKYSSKWWFFTVKSHPMRSQS